MRASLVGLRKKALCLCSLAKIMRLLQEVLVADEGGSAASGAPTAAAASYGAGYGGGHHYGHGYMSPTAYSHSAVESSGAGDSTMWIMMATVFVGYMALFFVMFSTWCACRLNPRTRLTSFLSVSDALAVLACLRSFWRPRAGAQAPFTRFPDMEQAQHEAFKHSPVSELDQVWRKAFVGKVYTLLVLQIAITLVICFGMMQIGGYDFYVWLSTAGAWTRMVAFVLTFVVLISMICFKSRYPMNLVLLFTFTCLMSYTVGVLCTAYAAAGMQSIVIEAFALTSLIFVGLTIFTMQSKIDFSFLGLVLPVLLFAFILWGFFSMIAFPSFMFSQVYALAGTIIFSLYVLYDTHAITTYLSYDDYVLGAINLYLDFVNLFLMILQLLMGTHQRE